jgi:putative chitinase
MRARLRPCSDGKVPFYMLTIPQLVRIMPKSQNVIVAWAGALEQAQLSFGILTPFDVAAFIANIAHESVELTTLTENLNYRDPARLFAMFKTHFRDETEAAQYVNLGPEAIANRVYASRGGNGDEASGDGWRFRGRGPPQLTFRDNYANCSKGIVGDATLVADPDLLTDPEFGAAAAAWYWATTGCSACSAREDFDGCCDLIWRGKKTDRVGDAAGFASRWEYFKRAGKETGIFN